MARLSFKRIALALAVAAGILVAGGASDAAAELSPREEFDKATRELGDKFKELLPSDSSIQAPLSLTALVGVAGSAALLARA
ncbi:hypothetical protein BESB_085540 [Besnoitia besnoiti]|uniref:Uncharacterized protein n=1 Tax=Besnoitia besnoiti TaxID=94643 RepID=A0A2A9M5X5_BESBE|nr:hypothetical protein BESB_085540 [Besnoitia besnoiti]PFH33355.1 hypothetical protein BESB_085540 [Besnoitia besnoiti]